jgi:hypothetical protein
MQASRQPIVQQHEAGRYSWLNPALAERPDHVSQCEMLGWILAEAVVNRTVPHVVFPPMLFSAMLARGTGREAYVPSLEEIEQFDPTLAKVSMPPYHWPTVLCRSVSARMRPQREEVLTRVCVEGASHAANRRHGNRSRAEPAGGSARAR